jgi:hypothetical protein
MFNKNNYIIVRKAVSLELSNFIMNYFLMQDDVLSQLVKNRLLALDDKMIGTWNDMDVPGAYSKYGDWTTEVLLMYLKNNIEKVVNKELVPTYSYTRVYKKGNKLFHHKDRPSCELSTTIFLGGYSWDFFLKNKKGKTIKVSLDQGDMLVYSGHLLEHWREPLKDKFSVQTFLHYNYKNGPYAKEHIYDKRRMLGLPRLEDLSNLRK